MRGRSFSSQRVDVQAGLVLVDIDLSLHHGTFAYTVISSFVAQLIDHQDPGVDYSGSMEDMSYEDLPGICLLLSHHFVS
jgi:hypothetical protein